MKYYKSRKQAELEDLQKGSEFMHQVSRPDGVNTDDVTKYRFNIIKHPTLDDYAICIDESDNIKVHAGVAQAAQGSGNFPSQDAFINNAGESARIKAMVRDNPHVKGHDLAPARWSEKTYTQLEDEGFFS